MFDLLAGRPVVGRRPEGGEGNLREIHPEIPQGQEQDNYSRHTRNAGKSLSIFIGRELLALLISYSTKINEHLIKIYASIHKSPKCH